jgi:hypothetical protein
MQVNPARFKTANTHTAKKRAPLTGPGAAARPASGSCPASTSRWLSAAAPPPAALLVAPSPGCPTLRLPKLDRVDALLLSDRDDESEAVFAAPPSWPLAPKVDVAKKFGKKVRPRSEMVWADIASCAVGWDG